MLLQIPLITVLYVLVGLFILEKIGMTLYWIYKLRAKKNTLKFNCPKCSMKIYTSSDSDNDNNV